MRGYQTAAQICGMRLKILCGRFDEVVHEITGTEEFQSDFGEPRGENITRKCHDPRRLSLNNSFGPT